jgi:calmodulin
VQAFDKDDLREMFEQIDEDGSGILDRGEVQQLMISLGTNLSTGEFENAMRAMDGDGSGEVDFTEFLSWWEVNEAEIGAQVRALQEDMANAQMMFDEVDADKSGMIDVDEVKQLVDTFGIVMNDDELDAAMLAMDEDGGGEVSFQEFYRWWSSDETKVILSRSPQPPACTGPGVRASYARSIAANCGPRVQNAQSAEMEMVLQLLLKRPVPRRTCWTGRRSG